MSFWNFLGGFAVFNFICDLFSSRNNNSYTPPQQPPFRSPDSSALQKRISELNSKTTQLDHTLSQRYQHYGISDDYDSITDEMQDRLDDIQDQIDELQDQIDELDDEFDDLDDFDDFDDLDA